MERYEVMILIVGIVSILLGWTVIVKPKILPYLVGGYLIVSGILWVTRSLL